MSEYIKIISAVLICCILITFIKDIKKEYSIMIALLSGIAVLVFALKNVSVIIGQINGFLVENDIDSTGFSVLIKAVGVSAVCQFACEMCADTNNRVLQFSVEFIGKTAILITSLPLVGSILKIISNYING